MRFIKLIVEAFQGVGRAELEFGPGLNVLYGGNDLGKSTLAAAVRAALLVLPKSAEADNYVSWYADQPPRVTLTFCDDEHHFWQVKKVFARSTSAELFHSKDGRAFALDCKAREVDEKLRGLLRWGIAAPGGKGASRGLPESFLSNTLLASQTDVDAILRQSLEKDLDGSGKIRLQQALATLAQDPLFKHVLDTAQREFDCCFTETGRRRRTQGSRLVAADEVVKRHQREHDELRARLEESLGIETHVRECRAAREECLSRVSDAQVALVNAQSGLTNAKARAEAEAQLTAARSALANIDAHAAQVDRLKKDLDALALQVGTREREFADTQTALEAAELDLRAAEDNLRQATAQQAEQGRSLRKAELETEAAKLRERRTQLESERARCSRAAEATSAVARARDAVLIAETERQRLSSERKQAQDEFQRVEMDADLLRAVLAYTRWQSLETQVAEAQRAARGASEEGLRADAASREADVLAARAQSSVAQIAERRVVLPSPDQLERLERLQHSLELAEAALGGGLNLVLRPRQSITVSMEIDGGTSEHSQLTSERSFEADRTLRLSIGDLVDVELSAGGVEQRRAVEVARAQWKNECEPVLAKVGASTLDALNSMVTGLEREDRDARELSGQAEKLRAEAQAARGRAELLEQQAKRLAVEPSELEAKRSAIGSAPPEVLEEHWTKLGKPNDARVEAAYDQHKSLLTQRKDRLATLEQEILLNGHVLQTAEQHMQLCAQQAEAALRDIGNETPEKRSNALELEWARCIESLTTTEAALVALAVEGSDVRAQAERGLASAREALELKRAASLTAQQVVEAERAKLNVRKGELTAQEQAFERLNRPAAVVLLDARAAALASSPSTPLATDNDVAAAAAAFERTERELGEADQAFYKAEGALTKVGGIQVQEQLQQAEEALAAARARERVVEIDADAWKLLRQALKQAEDSEAAHLGRALSGPVGQRFAELTGQRYTNLEFGPLLSAAGLQPAGVAAEGDVLSALSVGTRDQLATLVRLTIAHQLKSALILDDHLVQTDPTRLQWFREVLLNTALETQVLVFTCRPADYLRADELPGTAPSCDLAGGTIRAIDLGSVVQRWDGAGKSRS